MINTCIVDDFGWVISFFSKDCEVLCRMIYVNGERGEGGVLENYGSLICLFVFVNP